MIAARIRNGISWPKNWYKTLPYTGPAENKHLTALTNVTMIDILFYG